MNRKTLSMAAVLILLAVSPVSCGQTDEFIRQQQKVQPKEYRLQLDESEESVTVLLLKGKGKMTIGKKISGSYLIKYRPPQARAETFLVDKAEFVATEITEKFYPYSFDIDVKLIRRVFSGAVLLEEKKIVVKEGFRGTILDPDTGYGTLRAEETSTIDWKIKETL